MTPDRLALTITIADLEGVKALIAWTQAVARMLALMENMSFEELCELKAAAHDALNDLRFVQQVMAAEASSAADASEAARRKLEGKHGTQEEG